MPDIHDPETYCSWTEEKDTWNNHLTLKDYHNNVNCRQCLLKNRVWQNVLKQYVLNSSPIEGKLKRIKKRSHNEIAT